MIDTDAFLRQEVESATPAKLRWLLLQKAHGLTLSIHNLWITGQADEAKQWLILVHDIFTELLQGIVDPKHDLAQQQSDLYVFLTKLLAMASQTQDTEMLNNVSEILEIEKESWEMLVRREVSESYVPHNSAEESSTGFDFSA